MAQQTAESYSVLVGAVKVPALETASSLGSLEKVMGKVTELLRKE